MDKRHKFLWIFLFALLGGCSRQHQPLLEQMNRKTDPASELALKEIASRLPADDQLRGAIERGFRGSGVHESWMDDMEREGISEAKFEVKGTWWQALGFRPSHVTRTVYLRSYSSPGSQVIDEQALQKLRGSGLERKLEGVALQKARGAIWVRIDSNPLKQPGFAEVDLCEDAWLPCGGIPYLLGRGSARFSAFNSEEVPLYSAAIFPDLTSLTNLLASQHFSQADLNAALFGASECRSDNTKAISLLIQAGADVNARRGDGSTVLMEAASGLRLTHLKFLLASGADPNLRNGRNETAKTWVERRISAQDKNIPLPEGAQEIIRLLKDTGARH